MDTKEFKTRATQLHGDSLDFSQAEYTGPKQRLTVVCRAHGAFLAFPYNTLAGSGCGPCRAEAAHTTATAVFTQKFAEVHGGRYALVGGDYVNSGTKVAVVCGDHGPFTITPGNALAGKGCPKCAGRARGLASRARSSLYGSGMWEQAARAVHGDCYTYPHEFKGHHAYHTIVCPMHGEFLQQANNHLAGYGCMECKGEKHRTRCAADAAVAGEQFVAKAREVHGNTYTYENAEYTTAMVKLRVTCPTHGDFSVNPNSHLAGVGCARCTHRVSKAEQEIGGFLESHGLVVEYQHKFGKQSIDLWVPSHGIGIEHHGEWFHRDRVREGDGAAPRRPTLHREKLDAARAAGARLIQLWGTDWAHRKAQCRRLLLAAFGLDKSPALGARKCVLVRVARTHAAAFYREHHMRGWETGPAHFAGLTHDGVLVAVAAFTEHQRGVELVRFATSQRVPGACGRLVAWAQAQWPGQTLFSFSDNMLSEGGMYAALGFTKVRDGAPNYYMWQNNGKRLWHRRLFRHTTIAAWHAAHAAGKLCVGTTCRDKEESMDVWRVWDAGITRWELPGSA
jgi:hypothetical protein